MTVLFVCTGNICRSPMAEHLLRHMATRAGKTVDVMSAGVAAEVDWDMTDEAAAALRKRGVPRAPHRARQVDAVMMAKADVVLALEAHHRDQLILSFPHEASKVHVLKGYAGTGGALDGIADPYGGSAAVYERCLAQIDAALSRLIEKI